MAKRGRHQRGGRTTIKGTVPAGRRAGRPLASAPEPDLMLDVRRALADDDPLGLLGFVSSLLAALDPRCDHPLDARRRPRGPSRDELAATFIDVDRVETTALLTVIAEMVDNELLTVRIRRELAARQHPLPGWLTGLRDAVVYQPTEMVHVLGDGDNVILGVRLAEGVELSIVVYIDHNLGTIAKDAFVVPEPVGDLLALMREKAGDPDTAWNAIDPADARARITEAIAVAAMTYPPFESESWPACRPLVEWAVRHLPDGGTGYVRPEFDEHANAALIEAFFVSPYGVAIDINDHRSLLDSLLWFATSYGPGDPLRWSPTSVEILLCDWLPRKVVADTEYLSKAPALLRAFIRYCHDQRAIRPALTAQTLDAVDRFEPDYQRAIRQRRPQTRAGMLLAEHLLGESGSWDDVESASYKQIMLDALRRAVGDDASLTTLDDTALPDGPFAWDAIPADIHAKVREVLELCDACCDALLDVEYRTACRRFLARVAIGDPEVFRRKGRPNTAAAAVCWIIGKANHLFTPTGGGMLVKDLTAHFGLQQSGVSQRAATMLKAAGIIDEYYGEIYLGSPIYLVSKRRITIITHRDRYAAMADDD